MHCGKRQTLCNHRVGTAEERDGEAERLGGLKNNDQIELRGRFEIGCQECISSNSTSASFKSSVSKPSVNQS
jgi:hypothetical protein